MALRTPLSVTPHLYMGDSTGRPLDMGTVYFGEQDKDPEFYPINLFSDDALTKPLAQPVHTKGGYLYDKGDMVEPHAKELIYSVKVLDSYGRKVFYKGAMMRNSWNDDVIEQINQAVIGSADVARQVATDITNEAINNTAVEGGVLADTFVTMTKKGEGTIARNLREVNADTYNARDFGVKADGTTDDTVNLQAAIFATVAMGKTLVVDGEIKTSDTIVINGNVDMSAASILYYGTTGCAVEVSGISGEYVHRATIYLPRSITNENKTGLGWSDGTTGVRLKNLNVCRIFFGLVRSFETNLHITATGSKGTAYNEIHLTHLDNAKINLLISLEDSTGWVNENNFYGGRFSHKSNEGVDIAGTRHIAIRSNRYVPNNNVFYKPSIEGDTPEYHVELQGGYTQIISARWEAITPKVLYKKVAGYSSEANQATRNQILGGYGAQGIKFTHEGSGGGFTNRWESENQIAYNLSSTTGHKYINATSSTNPVISVYAAAGSNFAESIPLSEHTVAIGSRFIDLKSSTDTHPRIRLSSIDGRIMFGSGAEAPVTRIAYSSSGVSIVGNIWSSQPDSSIGMANYKYKNGHFSESVGMWGAAPPTSKPIVSGSLEDGTALKSLLAALASYGLIQDSTTS